MTESDWLTATDPVGLLFDRGLAHVELRKLALFGIAACRLVWDRLGEASRNRVVAAEQNEDRCWDGASEHDLFGCKLLREEVGIQGLSVLQRHAGHPRAAGLFRCVFGNPFRPVVVDPAWLTSDVVALAGGVYAERAFDRLPILADALQDAGCDHPDILAHCRSAGPHVRGCWVVDLLLGKT